MTPRLHLFNPGCEAEAARGRPGWTPQRDVAALARDLEALPWVLASPHDAVLVAEPPAPSWCALLEAHGVLLPRFVTTPADAPGHAPAPWGPSPDAARRLGAPWSAEARTLYRKDHWLPLLAELVARGDARVPGPIDVGRACVSDAAVADHVATLRAAGVETVVVKAPFGTSGRGAKRLPTARVATPSESGWIARTLREQGAVVVEPWRRRLLDLSLLLDVDAHGARILGATRFATDARGQYLGTWLATGLEPPVPAPWRLALAPAAAAVGDALHAAGHRGPAGLDAMVFADDAGAAWLKPLLEVNPRTTMGHVALALAARVAPGVHAHWRVFGRRELRALGHPDFPALAAALSHAHPLDRDPDGRLRSAALPTNDPARALVALGVLIASPAASSDGTSWALPL